MNDIYARRREQMFPKLAAPQQRAMSKRAGSTVSESAGSHAIYVSQPEAVAAIIRKAAQRVASPARSERETV